MVSRLGNPKSTFVQKIRKKEFANKKSILIDDLKSNISDWECVQWNWYSSQKYQFNYLSTQKNLDYDSMISNEHGVVFLEIPFSGYKLLKEVLTSLIKKLYSWTIISVIV